MNKTYGTLAAVFALLLGAGLAYTNLRILRLEQRLEANQLSVLRAQAQTVRYGFDPAFVDYFGEKGVEEVLKAVRLQKIQEGSPVRVLN